MGRIIAMRQESDVAARSGSTREGSTGIFLPHLAILMLNINIVPLMFRVR